MSEESRQAHQRANQKAVALRWDREHAPRITATGTGLTAEEILRVADEHGIPLQQDPALTEALAQIPLGEEIPPALYVAVAEVLAFVFMLAGIDPRQDQAKDDSVVAESQPS
ncbi:MULTISPECIES: EscU/YscU/HrcU family type III secretion system export apparatus switch protein [Thiorhodovibrio]|uniref:EscU/YscU/HrcU family type III secretion system export apparatus switch protein n=1 Tax=Thiorhodovibrio TaxID=61593 RepID=UPI00191267F7|nr:MULTISPECIES: EscU/YscU/HrcU family type III secretion system export apparatus switch protein [Thiorhodovibrio]MBK5971028.1 type III secretion protein [Thiorhodovibrio winogradskyi]WPL10605.1 Flagellar biosynthetic protein FlhB [Thiorhodovibrio litoralis]